jgi:predicted PurR-regulated permease PerM
MKFLTENMKAIVWLIDRVGVPIIVCAFLSYLIWVKFERLESRMLRVTLNQMAMMKKLHVEAPRGPEQPR